MTHHAPHVDLNIPHTSLIYYVNDADGDTLFFDEDYETQIDSVTPKKGRAVLFNGLIPHAAGIPTLGPRCIVFPKFPVGLHGVPHMPYAPSKGLAYLYLI